LAAPGYSLHNSGIAIDFRTRQGRHNLGPSTAQIALWNRSWFFRWLSANAANFGFAQNPNINEPWHWELVTGVELIEFSAQEGEVITPD
jgi:LAS superfamily LD-carboxypeptidase LdcB